MAMPVMHIGEMRMAVRDGRMPVRMRMWLHAVPREVVCMAMVFVMHMPMGVIQRLMRVQVFVPLGQVQPDAHAHQRGRQPERHRARLVEAGDGNDCADEGRGGKVRPCARGAEAAHMPKSSLLNIE